MARMYGMYARPRCPSCRAASGPDCADASRGKGGQRKYEERQWRREWELDRDDLEAELGFAAFLDRVWLPDWYQEKALADMNPIWVRF